MFVIAFKNNQNLKIAKNNRFLKNIFFLKERENNNEKVKIFFIQKYPYINFNILKISL
jgi:hypothetical protein